MPTARTILDCLRIRAANSEYLDSINSTQGTAIGFKKYTGAPTVSREPAIIVFVQNKINPKWLPASQLLAKQLSGPDNLTCHLDVVEGSKAGRQPAPVRDETDLGIRLRGWDPQVWVGSQITTWTDQNEGRFEVGSIGGFARDRDSGALGLITNEHIARGIGSKIFHPFPWGLHLATTSRTKLFATDDEWYGPLVDEPYAKVRIDCAFAKIEDNVRPEDINCMVMGLGKFGDPITVDIEDDQMSLIGKNVLRVGRTTGLRKGRIVAFGYEYKDERNESRYTDLLMIGTDSDATGQALPFSQKGDSGSLIVTTNGYRPVGLLWGGGVERRRPGYGQEKWSWGVSLPRVLNTLNVDLIS